MVVLLDGYSGWDNNRPPLGMEGGMGKLCPEGLGGDGNFEGPLTLECTVRGGWPGSVRRLVTPPLHYYTMWSNHLWLLNRKVIWNIMGTLSVVIFAIIGTKFVRI